MRTVIYIRVSTDQQQESGLGLKDQLRKCEAYAAIYDCEVVEVIEEAASAKSLRREGLQRALDMIASGEVEGLLIAKLDRLTRSVKDLGGLLEGVFSARGAILLSVSEQIDTRSAAGRLMLNLLSSVSQWEREVIGERTSAALQEKKRQGAILGRLPLGLKRRGKRIVKVTSEQVSIKRAKTLRASGMRLKDIAATLTAEGCKTQRGGLWSAPNVCTLLKRVEA
jgi:site-specific DNA recombinase